MKGKGAHWIREIENGMNVMECSELWERSKCRWIQLIEETACAGWMNVSERSRRERREAELKGVKGIELIQFM